MNRTVNDITLYGYIGKMSEKITTEKSSFHSFSISTKRGKVTDWHNVVVFEGQTETEIEHSQPNVGDYVRIQGQLTYRNREIKDSNGDVVTTVKEASVIAISLIIIDRKEVE
jgi:single-stranded DNA-binding protein